jgi:hypothetical protein
MAKNFLSRRPVYGRDHAAARASDERARRAQARREAEALFAPKPAVTANPVALPAKRARVLPSASAALPDASTHPEPVLATTIPIAHAARIRTWLRYGMTIAAVAAVYGVAAAEIEGALRRKG